MRDLLTIGEVARIMNMTTSQIRFYERKGLVSPEVVDENSYRLYGFDQLERLEVISMLRDLNLSIEAIREQINQKDGYDYKNILKQTSANIKEEMERLKRKSVQIDHMKRQYQLYEDGRIMIESFDERKLFVIDHRESTVHSPRDVFWFIDTHDINYLEPDGQVISLVLGDGGMRFCFHHRLNKKKKYDLERYFLPKGSYLSKYCTLNDLEGLDDIDQEIKAYAISHGIHLEDEAIIIHDLDATTYSNKKEYLIYQKRIKQ